MLDVVPTAPLGAEVVFVHQYLLRDAKQAPVFMAACAEVERAVAHQEYSLLVRLWQYGVSPSKPGQVSYILGMNDLASYSPWIKSKEWKQFLRTIRPLVGSPSHPDSLSLVMSEAQGLVVGPMGSGSASE